MEENAEKALNKKHKGKHDKPKPWDEDPNIDHWKVDKFDPTWNEGGMLEVSSFSTLFPQYRGTLLSKQTLFFPFFSCRLMSVTHFENCYVVCSFMWPFQVSCI